MKSLITIIIAIIACLPATAAKGDWAQFARYAAANDSVRAAANDGRRVVFLGNSITDNWAKMRPFFADNGFIGRGISGQTTYQFLVRFRSDVVDLKPAVVVINGGTNDVAENTHDFDIERTMDNIKSMVEIARANGIKVILTSVLPAAGFRWNPAITDAPERIAALNAAIAAYAVESGLHFVNYHPALLAPDARSLNPAFANDGVHPTADGYEVMEAIILPVVKKVLDE
ncbi:MAG: GDSL-type esterase/lipase family protein [Muribaculaceae bacterium]|nr:GDSL-type esterase/lipase family protein [Muribaculaceae bacterium]